MPHQQIKIAAFWIALGCAVIGGLLGMSGVWIDDFFASPLGIRLIATDVVLFLTASTIASIVTVWFGKPMDRKPDE